MESHQKSKTATAYQDHSKATLWAEIAKAPKAEPPASEVSSIVPHNVYQPPVVSAPKIAPTSSPKMKVVAPTFKVIAPDQLEASNKQTLEEVVEVAQHIVPEINELMEASTQLAVAEKVVKAGVATQRIAPVCFPHNLPQTTGLFLAQSGKAYVMPNGTPNPTVVPLGSKRAYNMIRKLGQAEGVTLRKSDLNDIIHMLQAVAETDGINKTVWYRVAPIANGIEIDLGDDQYTRVRISSGKVDVVTKGSETLFYRTPVSKPMVMPSGVGNLKLLNKYVNLHPVQVLLFTAWLSYTLAHPKVNTSKFLILVLQGNEGSGKSFLCWIIMMLIDPSILSVQLLPTNSKDLSIAAQNAHLLCYDNLREISHVMSDYLCTAATGGAISNRQLYSDAEQNVLYLHVAMVLNGIHSFVDQPDLAQRCLPLTLLPFNSSNRKSETQLKSEIMADLPAIMRGLFDLIAKVFTHLPTAEVTNRERMIDFVQWLAAMEVTDGAPVGIYQSAYSDVLIQGQLDTILDNPLAAVVLDFAQSVKGGAWEGTPADMMIELNKLVNQDMKRSKDWPQNAIALSKRLRPLQASLRTQGVTVEFARGKERTISIKSSMTVKQKGASNDSELY